MNIKSISTTLCVAAIALTSGCASYRVSSNVEPVTATSQPGTQPTQVLLAEDNLPNRKYKLIGPVEVSVKKLTLFHKDPTKEQANEALIERARALNSDAVISITYKTGIGLTTWGYIDAAGTAVKLLP